MEVENMDKEFFEGVLRKYEKNDSVIVDKIDIKPAVEKGNNFASTVSRVSIKGFKVQNNNEKSEYEISLIVKQLVKNKMLLELFRFDVIFANESAAYNIIIPTLSKYTPSGILKAAPCLLARTDIIVLKDLSQEGYINIDKKEDFPLSAAKLTLSELAKLHAASFVLRSEDSEKLHYLGTLVQEILFNNNNDTMIKYQSMNFKVAIYIFQQLDCTPQNEKVIKVIEDLLENSTGRQTKLITGNRKYKVMNHGDTWGNNIMLKDDSVILIDLQIMRYVSVAADLSYFLYINMKPSIRRQNYDTLLEHYLNDLHENMLACGVDMKAELTMDWLRQEMNDFAIFGVTSALWILPVFHYDMSDVDMDNDNGEEWNTLEFHLGKITDSYKDRVIELILDYVENNVD